MKSIMVKEMMIPLEDYATVSEEATLAEAVMALEEAQKKFACEKDAHRAILVLDGSGHVVGKVSQIDVIRGLEPRYSEVGIMRDTSRYGFSPEFISSMLEGYGLWRKPMDAICRRAYDIQVKTIMYTPTAGEFVREDATLDQAMHMLVMGHHESLLVTRNEEIVGILRLSDVFRKVSDGIKECSREA